MEECSLFEAVVVSVSGRPAGKLIYLDVQYRYCAGTYDAYGDNMYVHKCSSVAKHCYMYECYVLCIS